MTIEASLARRDTISIGPKLERTLDLAREAGLAVLLMGKHGIGKSEFLTGYAQARGISAHVLDLSLLEAPDLTGIPYVDGGQTRFAPPVMLPCSAASQPSLLVLEELNRCDRTVRQPCLQLIVARRLNEYRLPKDCFIVACVNPPDAGYDVEELDPALASRFLALRVAADRKSWLAWARAKEVHHAVIGFVEKYAQTFDCAPPRTWTYAARLISAAQRQGLPDDEYESLLRNLLPPIASRALAQEMLDPVALLPAAADVVLDPIAHVVSMRQLSEGMRLDAMREWLGSITDLLGAEQGMLEDASTRDGLRAFIQPAPPDLRTGVERLIDGKARRR